MRSPLAILREIRRNSRRVERTAFDRVQDAGFVLFAFIAPLVVARMESLRVRETSETLVIARVFEPIESRALLAREIAPEDRAKPWSGSVPMADVELVQRTEWRGWPLVTQHTAFATTTVVTRTASCPASREAEALRAANSVFARAQREVTADLTRNHIASWVFSSGAWWMMLSLALAAVLAPIRFGWFLYRRTRTVVRQSRIDRCHCPNCGYNAKHSILMGRCPECGSELYERPDVY